MKINRINYIDENGNANYFQVIPEEKRCSSKDVNEVISITEHQARGEGDKWYYDVEFKDQSIMRLFNFNSIEFKN